MFEVNYDNLSSIGKQIYPFLWWNFNCPHVKWFWFQSPSYSFHYNMWQSVILYTAAAAKSLQSCLTLCDPRDGSPPGSPVPGILQARTLEWVAISFSKAWKWKVKVKSLSRAWLLATPWTAAYQSMGFFRQEYWSGVPLPSLILYTSKFQLFNCKLKKNLYNFK